MFSRFTRSSFPFPSPLGRLPRRLSKLRILAELNLVRFCRLVRSKYFCSQSGEILMKAQHTRRLWDTVLVEDMS